VLAGLDDELTVRTEHTFVVRERRFDGAGDGEVVMQRADLVEPEALKLGAQSIGGSFRQRENGCASW
jgi:hypothetical protein